MSTRTDAKNTRGVPPPTRLDDLPPSSTRRWVARRKAQVVAAVHAGLLTLDQACQRYSLSMDEFLAWQHAFTANGIRGLRATKGKEAAEAVPPPHDQM